MATSVDIVERLRDPYIVLTAMVVRREAAVEIERLRKEGDEWEQAAAEIERLREELHYCTGTCDLAMKHRDVAEAEIERLRGPWISGTSETDERLLRANLLKCYGTKTLAFRVSKEHYRYLAEQIIALREHLRRHQLHINAGEHQPRRMIGDALEETSKEHGKLTADLRRDIDVLLYGNEP